MMRNQDPFWAGTSAALVCQPQLGASLRKGWYRMIGTVVGAVAIVALTACFPQDRSIFLVGLALWGAACTLVATLLSNFASYAAALAGFTAVIIASDQLGATGGPNGQTFMLGVTRISEISYRYRVRRHGPRRNRFRHRAASAGRDICRHVGRNRGPIHPHVGAGRIGPVANTAGSTRTCQAGHCP